MRKLSQRELEELPGAHCSGAVQLVLELWRIMLRVLDCSVQEGTGWGPWRRWWSPSETGTESALPFLPEREQYNLLLSALSMHRTKGPQFSGQAWALNGALEEGNTDLLTLLESNFFQLPPWEQGRPLSYGFSLSLLRLLPACLLWMMWLTGTWSSFILLPLLVYRNYKVINTQCEDIQM